MSYQKTRKAVSISNIVIVCLCLISMLSYLVLPFWKITVSYSLNAEVVKLLLSSTSKEGTDEEPEGEGVETLSFKRLSSQGEEETQEESFDIAELLKDEEFFESLSNAFKDENFKFELSLTFKTTDVMSSLGGDGKKVVQAIVETNVNNLVEQVSVQVNDTILNLPEKLEPWIDACLQFSSYMYPTLYRNYFSYIENPSEEALNLLEGFTPEKVRSLIDEAFSVEDLVLIFDKAWEAFFSEDATAESASETIADLFYELIELLRKLILNFYNYLGEYSFVLYYDGSENFGSEEYFEEMNEFVAEFVDRFKDKEKWKAFIIEDQIGSAERVEQEIFDAISWIFKYCGDENGKLEPRNLFQNLLTRLLQELPILEEEFKEKAEVAPLAFVPANDETNAQPPEKDLETMLRDYLIQYIPAEVEEIVTQVMKYTSYLILFSLIVWAYPVLKIVAKLRSKNNAIKLGVPIWLGCAPFVILQLLPSIAFGVLKSPPSFLADLMGTEALGQLTAVLAGLNVSFLSCSVVSFAVSVFFVFFCIFYYGRMRRRLKRMKNMKNFKNGKNFSDREIDLLSIYD